MSVQGKKRRNYDVVFQSKAYQIVKNKPINGEEDAIEIVKQDYKIPTKLPNVKMHLQSERKPNMANAHEARFDNINKEPSIYSKSKRQPIIDFDKMNN